MVDDERYLIETAGDGEEALRLLRERAADIVLTDLRMPRMDGLTLLGEIRLRYPDTFVLILTGVDSAVDAVRAMKAGAYDYIPKPLDMDAIRRQLKRSFSTGFC
jgi:DNA-binding NtrC family response regulator